jgi:hypothetical protein
MSEKNLASTLATSLVPLGALALVAGCGGGGTAIPPSAVPANNAGSPVLGNPNGPSVTAQLTVTIPARGAQALKRSKPQYISPGSGAIGVTVAGGAQQVFSLPTPGPAPATTTLPVKAPVGTDTIAINVYDVSPAATASPNLLSTGTTTAVISPTALNTPSVTALGVPAGVVLSLANNPTPAPLATVRPWTPLEHSTLAQNVTIDTTAVDALGYTITGALATAAPITVTGPVTLSAASVTSASSSVTATYPQGSTAVGTVGSTLPLTSGTVAVQPDYGVFASGPSISVIDGLDRTLSVVGPGAASGAIAATSCNGGAIAVSPASGSLKIVTLAPSTAVQPVPAAALTSLAISGLTASSPVAFDASCNAYTAVALGGPPVTSYAIQKISGFGGTVAASTLATLSAVSGTAGTQGVTLSVAGSTLYAGEYAVVAAGPPAVGATYTVALSGGATALQDSNVGESVAVSGTTVYKVWDTAGLSPSCPYAGPDLQDLQASQGLLSSPQFPLTSVVQPLVAANDGTLYALQTGTFFQAVPPIITGPWVPFGPQTAIAFALSPDPANTYVCEAVSSPMQISFYTRATLGSSPTPPAVTLGYTPTGVAAAP